VAGTEKDLAFCESALPKKNGALRRRLDAIQP